MTQFITRAYNSFKIDETNNSIICKYSEEKRLADEINYYLNLPKELEIYFPRIIDHHIGDHNKLCLELYGYNNLGTLFQSKTYFPFWGKVFKLLSQFMNNCQKFQIKGNIDDIQQMYITKTETEYEKLMKNFSFFSELRKFDTIYINGDEYKSFDLIWPRIKEYLFSLKIDYFNYIHGDLCFSNILYGQNGDNVILKFIDPRGTFGQTKFYGDPYYDLAKLSHSTNGNYEMIITDQFECEDKTNNEFHFNINGFLEEPYYWFRQADITFEKFVNEQKYDMTKIKMLEGCIFIGMIARHYDSLDRQKAMYLTGLRILNDMYDKL